MNLRRASLRLLLAGLLLFAQQQAVLHLLTHSFEQLRVKQDQSIPHDAFCEKCLTLAHLDHAVAGAMFSLPVSFERPDAPLANQTPAPEVAFLNHYRSRAPPALS